MYKLFARPGWGSVLVEAQLAWYGLPYEIEDLDDLFKSTEARERLRPVNPLAQVPTLMLPDGQVLTESAAITLHLADATQSADLVPGPGENARPAFLISWLDCRLTIVKCSSCGTWKGCRSPRWPAAWAGLPEPCAFSGCARSISSAGCYKRRT